MSLRSLFTGIFGGSNKASIVPPQEKKIMGGYEIPEKKKSQIQTFAVDDSIEVNGTRVQIPEENKNVGKTYEEMQQQIRDLEEEKRQQKIETKHRWLYIPRFTIDEQKKITGCIVEQTDVETSEVRREYMLDAGMLAQAISQWTRFNAGRIQSKMAKKGTRSYLLENKKPQEEQKPHGNKHSSMEIVDKVNIKSKE